MKTRRYTLEKDVVEPEIIWVPSHHEEKLKDPRVSDKEKREHKGTNKLPAREVWKEGSQDNNPG
jgi:hypothetical protein